MSSPLIVQGTAVPQGNGKHQTYESANFDGYKGEPQPKKFNDVGFAIAFVAQLLVMAGLGVTYGPYAVQNNNNNNNNGGNGMTGVSTIVFIVTVCSMFAAGLSSLSLGFMMKFPRQLVKVALIFSVIMSGVVGALGLLSGNMMLAISGFLSCAFGVCYAFFAWSRIPFAAANLNTALTAVRLNMGMVSVSLLMAVLAFGWSIFWSVAAGGTMNALGQSALFFFFLSYYWVHQVLQNTVHVTSAGVVGTWWFAPNEASSCCSSAITDSFARATTYSFGSICFGSLLVAIVQALRATLNVAKSQEDTEGCNMVVCVLQCILSCIEGIIEELNKWAYVYVGLYGYPYVEAGRNVMTLFQNKGWSSIITDDLCENVLAMMSLAIGLLTGLVGLVVASMNKNALAAAGFNDAGPIGFILGLIVGYALSSILMSVVSSSVNTVIVCFAEAPAEFRSNHPQLCAEMTSAWQEAWPGSV